MSITDQIEKVRSEFSSDLEKSSAENSDLDQIRIKYLGRKGLVSALFVHMGTVSNEERPKIGQALNMLKKDIEADLETLLSSGLDLSLIHI